MTVRFTALLAILAASCSPAADAPVAEPRAASTPAPRAASAASASPTLSLTPQEAGLALPARFSALGTEPFWSIEIDGDQLVYRTPENQAGTWARMTRRAIGDTVEFAGDLAGATLRLTVSAGPCSDGMSDVVYPWTVRRALGDDVQNGCARVR